MQLHMQRRGATLSCKGEMQLSAGEAQLQLWTLPLPMRGTTLRRDRNSGSGVLTFQREEQALWMQPQHAGLSSVLWHVLAVLAAVLACVVPRTLASWLAQG